MDHSARNCAQAYKHTAGPVASRTNRQCQNSRRRPSRRHLPFQGSSNQKPSELVCTYYQVGFLTSLVHFVDYLRVRLSETCFRGALKNTYPSVNILLRFIRNYSNFQSHEHDHLFSDETAAIPGTVPRQPPRMFVSMLVAGQILSQTQQHHHTFVCMDCGSWSSLGGDAVLYHHFLQPLSVKIIVGTLSASLTARQSDQTETWSQVPLTSMRAVPSLGSQQAGPYSWNLHRFQETIA